MTAKAGLLMLNVNDQDQSMMLKFLQIPQFVKNYSLVKLNQTSLNLLPGSDTLPNYVTGDPAYPLNPYCTKEYQTCVENKQVVFNNLLIKSSVLLGDSRQDGGC